VAVRTTEAQGAAAKPLSAGRRLGEQLGWRHSGEFAKIAREMRLIVTRGDMVWFIGSIGPGHPVLDQDSLGYRLSQNMASTTRTRLET
jgi:hypothetical protein